MCIHFDARLAAASPFAFSRRVEYREERPFIPIPLDLSGTEVARRVALTKHTDWDHEREYRLLGHSQIELNLKFDGRRGRFNGNCIVGVTVGHLMPSESMALVRELACAHDPPIPIFRANPRLDSFSYSIDQL